MHRLLPVLKLLAIVIVGLFIVKFLSKYVVTKFPNKVTQSIDTVVSAV